MKYYSLITIAFVVFSCSTSSSIDEPTISRMPNGTYQGGIIYGDINLFSKLTLVGNTFEEVGSELSIPQKPTVCLAKGNYVIDGDRIIFTQTNSTTDPTCTEALILNGEYNAEYTEFTLVFWKLVQNERVEYRLDKLLEE